MAKCGWCIGPPGALVPHCRRGEQTAPKQNAAKTCTCGVCLPVAPEIPRIKRRKRAVK